MKQLKILHIIKKSSYDGASVYPIRLIMNLRKYDHKLLSIYKGSAHNEIINNKIKYSYLLKNGDDIVLNKILKSIYFIKYLLKNKYDIIHYHLGGVVILLLATILKKKAKVIHHMHSGNVVGNIFSDKLTIMQKIILKFLNKRNIQIAVAENVKTFYINSVGNSEYMKTIKNFTPFQFQRKENRLKRGIGFLGRITKEKGFDIYIDLINHSRIERLKYFAKGDVYGYSSKIKKLEKKEKFKYLYPSFNIEQLFENIDILIFPSIAPESFGLVLIEAISFDIGIIALNSKAVSETLGNYPLIVDDFRVDLIEEKVREYYSDKMLRENLSKIHYKITKSYSMEKSLSAIKNIYDNIKVLT